MSVPIYYLIRDYLADQTVSLTSDGSRVTRRVKKGAPQGSIFGPNMWNMCMDPVRREVQERGGEIVAYADDLLLLVTGGSRTDTRTVFLDYTAYRDRWREGVWSVPALSVGSTGSVGHQ
uniref:Reverse transcriptase domain-containing protein n=1 Tax=Trichogramma kaykai TaxID=54128 RepID=A0ABD2W5U7_9HYME